jgi:hypothetical protein
VTGRDLIVYILTNGLENVEVYKDGAILGFMTAAEAASKFDVGLFTVYVWVSQGVLDGIWIGGMLYIPAYAKRPNIGDK